MYMPFQLTVGALVTAMMAVNYSVVVPVSATLHLRKAIDVRSIRKMQTKPQQQEQTVTAAAAPEETLCDVDLAIVSFEYCFYSCGLDEAGCQDLIETSTTTTNATTVPVTNRCTNATIVVPANSTNVTSGVAADSGNGDDDEGDPMACQPNPSGFALVEAFRTVSDATTYCSDNCGLDEEECTRWKQRYILADMQRRRRLRNGLL
jgi:hypothetical protein